MEILPTTPFTQPYIEQGVQKWPETSSNNEFFHRTLVYPPYVPLKDQPREGFASLCTITDDLQDFMNIDHHQNSNHQNSNHQNINHQNICTQAFATSYLVCYARLACINPKTKGYFALNEPLLKLFAQEIKEYGLDPRQVKHENLVKCLRNKIKHLSKTEVTQNWENMDKFEPVNVLLHMMKSLKGEDFEMAREEFEKQWKELKLAPLN